MKNKLIVFLVLLLLLSACVSKKYTRQAVKFDEAGLYEDAADYYYKAIKKKPTNVEAKIGLSKTGQLALDAKLQEVKSAYKRADYKEAVYHYMDADSYSQKMKQVGVNLLFPEIYEAYFEEAKDDYIGKRYAEGVDKLDREEFDAAQKIFVEIRIIDEDYKDVSEKYTIATYEPLYRRAAEYLDNEKYRRAYYTYKEINRGAGSYKQSISLKDEALEKGTMTILVSDFKYNQTDARQAAENLAKKAKSDLSRSSNPFIKILSSQGLETDIYKNGDIDLDAARLAGIDAILSGEVLKLNQRPGLLKKENRKGYIKEVNRTKNKEGVETVHVDYHKTTYTEYRIRNSMQLNAAFQLLSTENGEILVGDQWELAASDEAHWASYDGDPKKLVPGYWKYRKGNSDEDVVKDNYSDIRSLKGLLKADKKIKQMSVLQNELINEAAKSLKQKVERYDPEE